MFLVLCFTPAAGRAGRLVTWSAGATASAHWVGAPPPIWARHAPAGMKSSSPGPTSSRSPPTTNCMRPATTATSSSSLRQGRAQQQRGWGRRSSSRRQCSRGRAGRCRQCAAPRELSACHTRPHPCCGSPVHEIVPLLACLGRGGQQAGKSGRCRARQPLPLAPDAKALRSPRQPGSRPPPPGAPTRRVHKQFTGVAARLPVARHVLALHGRGKLVAPHWPAGQGGAGGLREQQVHECGV